MADEQLPQEPLTGQVEDATPSPDEYMSAWGRRCNALSDKAWKACQIALGAALGAACAACLFFMQSEGFLPLNFLVAFAVAKFGPDMCEKGLERKMPTTRIAMIIALAACLIGYTVYKLAMGEFSA